MNAKNPGVFQSELEQYLARFEGRLRESGNYGLTLHTGITKKIANDLKDASKKRDDKLYEELMGLETVIKEEVQPSEASLKALDLVYKLKGIVNVACFMAAFITVLPTVDAVRRPNSGRMKIENMEVEAEIWD